MESSPLYYEAYITEKSEEKPQRFDFIFNIRFSI